MNTSITTRHNIVLSNRLSTSSPFTPGWKPSVRHMILDVPYSNPPIRLIFDEYELRPDRNETDAEDCFKQAVLECFDPRKQSVEFEVGVRQRWGSGEMRLYLTPEDQENSPDPTHPRLTYGKFTDALRGLNNFRLFYPHLDFYFDIYQHPPETDEETWLGLGRLFEISKT